MPRIEDARILIISTHGFEQSELEFPRDHLREKGATVHVATLDGEKVRGWDGADWGQMADADLKVADARADDYDALVIPGGQINPDLLRVDDDVLNLVRGFHDQGKTIAAVCHAPWVLVEAGLAKDRAMTSYHSIRTDVTNAGANWRDESVVSDQGIVTSRNPGDLEDFTSEIVKSVEQGGNVRHAA